MGSQAELYWAQPRRAIDPPKANYRAMHTLHGFEVGILLDAAQNNNHYNTAIGTGLRVLGPDDLVFANPNGGLIDPSVVALIIVE